jgi:formylglycine-generating enzyme required for sulfatase activity
MRDVAAPARLRTVAAGVVLLLVGIRADAVVVDWVTVGAPGNPADSEVMHCCFELRGTTGFGAVGHVYRIGRFEITNAQYAEFLNAVASVADPNALYNPSMGLFDNIYGKPGGILRSGSPGAWVYEPYPGYADRPVRFTDFYRAARMVNWLHNAQPSGAQGPATTEDGAYALLGTNPVGITRRPEALFWVPSEDEWYKAAYYDPALGYWDWATSSNEPPAAGYPPGGPNSANISTPPLCEPPNPSPCELTDVGSYVSAVSPWGTFDQVGNIHEWTETPTPLDPTLRVLRGGPWTRSSTDAAAFGRNRAPGRCDGCWGIGFRLAAQADPDAGPCDDGNDNDGDGAIDLADPGCANPDWPREDPQCQDGADNDGDLGTDFDGGVAAGNPTGLPDPHCAGKPWRDRETGTRCGLGLELPLALVPAWWRLRRRRSDGPRGA